MYTLTPVIPPFLLSNFLAYPCIIGGVLRALWCLGSKTKYIFVLRKGWGIFWYVLFDPEITPSKNGNFFIFIFDVKLSLFRGKNYMKIILISSGTNSGNILSIRLKLRKLWGKDAKCLYNNGRYFRSGDIDLYVGSIGHCDVIITSWKTNYWP